jgi:hypothetical protein
MAAAGGTMSGLRFRLMSGETDLGFNCCVERARGASPALGHTRGTLPGHGHSGAFGGGSMPMSRHRRSL